MRFLIFRLLIAILCSLPGFAAAATTQSIHVEWGYTPPSEPAVSGFKLYQEGVFACQTQDPAATSMDCQVTLSAATTNFTLTAAFSDGTESPHSAPFSFAAAIAPSVALQAVLTANAVSGTTPLTVAFDASSSTGEIASYLWDFGDGSTATGSSVSHVYAASGAFTARLTVTGATGQTSAASTTITATAPVVAALPAPPTAVISSSSTAAGPAPLTVRFSASDSTAAPNASISSYAWAFGDGATASAASTAHTFTSAGTYTTVLTVADNNGQISTTSTPVVVTTPAVAANTPPTAVANASATSGAAPLAVAFDGSASTDADGSISSYLWNFGDGSSATGKTATHTYLNNAAFTATLQVTDNKGATSATSIPIALKEPDLFAGLNIELGEIAVGSNWVRVPLSQSYQNPIVVAGSPGFNNAEPCVVRLRNVTQTGFDIKLAEWNYLDGIHPEENITYLVMEKGRITLPDGSSVEAGTFQGSTNSTTVKFSKSFAAAPVVMSTVASDRQVNTISGRIKNIGRANFSYSFREQEKNRNSHVKETVNFIAWQPGKGTIGSVQYEVAVTAKAVTNAWHSRAFAKAFTQPPLLLADMQTTNNTDTSALRVQNTTAAGFQVKVEEEQSKDKEVTHPAEVVGYLVFDKIEE